MFKFLRLLLVAGLLCILVSSCRKDDEPLPSEQELITTVKLTLTNQSDPTNIVTATWKDIDGPGGNAPVIQPLTLAANSVYGLLVEFLDESDPANIEDITEEIEEEDVDHEVFYQVQTANLTVSDRKLDKNGLPLGLEAVVTTGAASTGNLRVILIHKPGQKAAGDTVDKGEPDIDVTFPVTIQ